MALLVEQLQWLDPLTPETLDPAWEDEVRGITGGFLPAPLTRVAWSPWVRRAYLDCVRMPVETLARSEQELAGLLTSQENACRYCYGSARVRMKMIGFSDEMIDRIERNAQLVEADPARARAGAVLPRARPLEAAPEPEGAREDARGRLHAHQTAELAFVVAVVGFCNRVSTLLAVPPELEMEEQAKRIKGIWNKLSAWLPARSR